MTRNPSSVPIPQELPGSHTLSREVKGEWLSHSKAKGIKGALRLFGLFAIANGGEQLQKQAFSFLEKGAEKSQR